MKKLFTIAFMLIAMGSLCQTYTYIEPNANLEKEKRDKEAFFKKRKDDAFTRLQNCTKQCGSYAADANNPKDPCTLQGATPSCICACNRRYDDSIRVISQQENSWQLDIAKRKQDYENQQMQASYNNNKIQSNNSINGTNSNTTNTTNPNNRPQYNLQKTQQEINSSIDDITNAVVNDMNKKYENEKRQRNEEYTEKKQQEQQKLEEDERQSEISRQLREDKDNELLAKFYKGLDYCKAGNYTEGIAIFQEAQDGPIRLHANYALAALYYYGTGLTQDYAKAFSLMKTVADASIKSNATKVYLFQIKTPLLEDYVTKAAYFLGVMYENGQGVEKNVQEAMNWYKRAADRGHDDAQKRIQTVEKTTTRNKELLSSNQVIANNLYKMIPIKFNTDYKDIIKYEFGTSSTKLPNYTLLPTITCTSPDKSSSSLVKYLEFSRGNVDPNNGIIKRSSKTINSIVNYLHNNELPTVNFYGDVTYYFVERRLIEISITIEQAGIQNGEPGSSVGINAFCIPIIKAFNNGIELPKYSFAFENNNLHYMVLPLKKIVSEGKYRYQLTINIGNEIAFNNLCLTDTIK